MDTAERRRASRLDAAGMPGSARAPSRASGARRNLRFLWRRGPKTLKIFFACGGQLISILSLSQLFHTTLSVTRSAAQVVGELLKMVTNEKTMENGNVLIK